MPVTSSKPSLGPYYQTHRDSYNNEFVIRLKGTPDFPNDEIREHFRDDVINTVKSDIRYILNANGIGRTMQRNFLQYFKEIFKNLFDHADSTGTCLLKVLSIGHIPKEHSNKILFCVKDGNKELVKRDDLLNDSGATKRKKKGKTNSGVGIRMLNYYLNGDMAEQGVKLEIDTTQGGITYVGSLTMPRDEQGEIRQVDSNIYGDRSITI